MVESVEGYFLVAHVTNVVSYARAEVEWEVASESPDGDWFTNEGHQIYPFHTIPIILPAPAIPMGWVEHIQAIAHQTRTEHSKPSQSLAQRLGLTTRPKAQPIIRRL